MRRGGGVILIGSLRNERWIPLKSNACCQRAVNMVTWSYTCLTLPNVKKIFIWFGKFKHLVGKLSSKAGSLRMITYTQVPSIYSIDMLLCLAADGNAFVPRLCSIHWSHALSREWKCSCISADILVKNVFQSSLSCSEVGFLAQLCNKVVLTTYYIALAHINPWVVLKLMASLNS